MDNAHQPLTWSDILTEALKRSGACGADLLKAVNSDIQYENISKVQELIIFSLIPGIVLALIAVGWILEKYGNAQAEIAQSVALLAIFLGGGNRFFRGLQDLLLRHTVTVDVFVSVALIATIAIGEFLSAAIVIFIMSVSGAIEGYTMDKSNRSIRHFLSLSPKTATVLIEERETEIEVDEISIGDQIVVHPGERIPADGIVISGFADVNETAITGEAVPVSKKNGSTVFAGTLNESGRLVIEVNKELNDTVFARIAKMVHTSQTTKAPIQRTVDRFTADGWARSCDSAERRSPEGCGDVWKQSWNFSNIWRLDACRQKEFCGAVSKTGNAGWNVGGWNQRRACISISKYRNCDGKNRYRICR